MAKCIYCGSENAVHFQDGPVCRECADGLDREILTAGARGARAKSELPRIAKKAFLAEMQRASYTTCAICRDLLQAYTEAAEKLGPAAKSLSDAAISYEQDAFVRAWDLMQRAKNNCRTARHELHAHLLCHSSANELSASGLATQPQGSSKTAGPSN